MPELPSPSLPETSPSTLQPTTEQSTAPKPHSAQRGGKRIVLIAGAVLVGLGAFSGLGYAAWAGYLPNPLIKRPTPEQFFTAINTITSAQTTVDVHFALEPKESDVEPLDFSLFQEKTDTEKVSSGPKISSFANILPGDLELNLSIASSFTKQEEGANEETHIAGTYNANNISANIDLTTRTVNGTTYIKPDAIPLPIPIFDLSVLEGKWINLGEETDSREVFEYTDALKNLNDKMTEKNEDEKISDPQAELFSLLQQGVNDGAVIFSVPERVTYNDKRAWYTEAIIDGEKLRETIIAMGENRETLFPTVTEYTIFTDDFLETTGKERAKDIYRELFKRTTLSATLDNNASPLMVTFSTRIAPKLEDDIFEDRQITFETKIHFDSINTAIEITAPEETITTKDAVALIMGTNPDEDLADEQRDSISDIQSALSMYKEKYNEYPKTLEELIGIGDEDKEVVRIPFDIFTEEAYDYDLTESGYTLRYTMPENGENTFSRYDLTVEGTNTATELFFSEEGAKLTDADEDGLTAYEELSTYGTSDDEKDTDGDGFDDKTEIDAGYDPNSEKLQSDPMPRRLI